MKRLIRFCGACLLLLPLATAFPQGVMHYVKAQSGDTLLIKDYYDMSDSANSLYLAMFSDTVSLPKTRVYQLETGGYYPLTNGPNTTTKQPTTILGQVSTPLVENTVAAQYPPIICGSTVSGGTTQTPGITANNNFLIANCVVLPTVSDGTEAWSYFGPGTDHIIMTIQNCLMEHTRWVFCNSGDSCTFNFIGDYFINMNGQPCRRNGGVYDGFANDDTMLVENCTHVMAQGSVYKLRSNIWERVIINHNTFVNMAGYVFMSLGYQSNMSVTNNLFLNCGVQPYPGIQSIDAGEQDIDWIPMGLVNVYPDSADVFSGTKRKFLCQGNDAYWDPSLANIVTMENSYNSNAGMDGRTNWKSQMIIFNTRTDSVFKHIGRFTGTPYSYCNTDTWLNVMPTFKTPSTLFTTQLSNLKTFAYETVDTSTTDNFAAAVLPDFRVTSTGANTYIYPDWPIPINLSYTDQSLLTHGTDGLPVGDLNWFPTAKATFTQNRTTYYTKIQTALDAGQLVATAVREPSSLPGKFELQQNYPNPFNPSTQINFSIPQAGNVSLKVYNILGQEVATLMDGVKSAQTYNVTFDASKLSSGVYFYTLKFGEQSISKKMLLLK